ncbi:hypothetical protein GCM10007868_09430 [Gluconobacter frateurii]|nr:hypothetical protein GCM10007868_09430 [Gluconobacter frateurii]
MTETSFSFEVSPFSGMARMGTMKTSWIEPSMFQKMKIFVLLRSGLKGGQTKAAAIRLQVEWD